MNDYNKFDNFKKQIRENKIYSKIFGNKRLVMKCFEFKRGYRFDLKKPVTFSEKINSRKLEKNKLYQICADKIRVRDYVKEKVGEKYLTKLYFTSKKMTEELFDKMPNKCVLKTAGGSGTIKIILDKKKEDKNKVVNLLNSYLDVEFAYIWGEMFYKKIPKEILCEELLLDKNGEIPEDYKFHCFNNNGKIKIFTQVDFSRFKNHKRNIYDENFNLINMRIYKYDNYKGKVKKPKNYEEMVEVAKKLSEDFEYVRVDLYNVDGKIYFGELTFTHGAGFEKFYPNKYDKIWGSYWNKQGINKKKVCFFMETPFSFGGEQRAVTILSNLLINKGYDVTIACTDNTIIRNNDLYNLDPRVKTKYINGYNNKLIKNIRKRRLKLFNKNLETGKYKNSLFKQKYINCDYFTKMILKKFFNKGKYDYVVGLSTKYNTMLARISKSIKAKTIGWQHSQSIKYFDTEGRRHYNQDKYSRYMFKKLDAYVTLTKEDKKWLKNKFNVDAVSINNPKSIVSDRVTDLKNKNFIAVGIFTEVKNHLALIDMFNEFHKYNKEWKLIILGDGELKKEYIKRIKKYNLEKYVIIENFTTDVSKYYLKSSVCLMPSLWEGYSMVMTEALEFGLPLICFDMPCAREMIEDNKSGFIVEPYNQKEYVNKMLEIANDKELLKNFSKRTREISNKKTHDSIVNEWIKLFNKIDKK